MAPEVEFEGRTERDAVTAACQTLGVNEAHLDYTVIDQGSGGLFGIGARPVRIRARSASSAPVVSAPAAPAPAAPPAEASASPPAEASASPAPRRADEDKIAKAREVAEALARHMGMAAVVKVREEPDQIVVTVDESNGATDVATMLGRARGSGVSAFQFLLNKIVNRFPDDRKHILVEAPSIPDRPPEARDEEPAAPRPARAPRPAEPKAPDEEVDPELAALARGLADKAKALGKVITIHPMAPGDRRAIHVTITGIEGVETISEGDGLYRKMHIVPSSLTGRRAAPAGEAPSEGGREGGGRRRRRRRGRRRGAGGPGAEGGQAEAPREGAGGAGAPPPSEGPESPATP